MAAASAGPSAATAATGTVRRQGGGLSGWVDPDGAAGPPSAAGGPGGPASPAGGGTTGADASAGTGRVIPPSMRPGWAGGGVAGVAGPAVFWAGAHPTMVSATSQRSMSSREVNIDTPLFGAAPRSCRRPRRRYLPSWGMPKGKDLLDLTLGIVTSVGGFLEIGSIATSAQAGALFGYRLLWAVALGGLCLIFLIEMAGRFAAVTRHTIPDAMRERFGWKMFVIPLVGLAAVGVLVLAAELGGAAAALELGTGIDRRLWILPVTFLGWLLLWRGTFAVIEKGVSLLALVSVCFLVAAIVIHPPLGGLAAGLVPRAPDHQHARYWFLAVAILGASISPFLYLFYPAGAVEDPWNRSKLGANRVIAGSGMSFGTVLAGAVVVVAALALRGVDVQHDR